MVEKRIKNMKLIPTSELILHANNYQSDLDNILIKRLTKKYKINYEKSKHLIKRDQKIILSKGNNIKDYVFDYNRGLSGTIEALYKKIEKPNNQKFSTNQTANLTFSELCIGYTLINKLTKLYKKRNNELEKHSEDNYEYIKILEFYKTLYSLYATSISEITLNEDNIESIFLYYINEYLLNSLIAKENRLCMNNESKKNIKAEFECYQNSSFDVISLDTHSITKSEGTTKIYTMATHSNIQNTNNMDWNLFLLHSPPYLCRSNIDSKPPLHEHPCGKEKWPVTIRLHQNVLLYPHRTLMRAKVPHTFLKCL